MCVAILDIPIVYAFQDSDQFNPARLFNYCQGGMCFETGEAVEPGSDIYIMMENFLPDSIDAEFYDGYLAEVRWCRKHSLNRLNNFVSASNTIRRSSDKPSNSSI